MILKLNSECLMALYNLLDEANHNCMALRHELKAGTLLGAFKKQNGAVKAMFSFNDEFLELETYFENGNIGYTMRYSDGPLVNLKRLEDKTSKYILNRIADEFRWLTEENKFSPKYVKGKVYLRRAVGTVNIHNANVSKAAMSGAVARPFAAKLTSYDLKLVFTPAS